MKKPLEVLKLYPEHDYTLNGAFASRAQRDPRRPFILFGKKTWSWAEFGMAGESNISRLWLQPEERMMVVLPMFHVNALFYSTAGALAAGCSMVLMPRFSASEFWNAAVEYGVTQVNIIEAIGRILARRPRSEFRPEHRITKLYGARADIVAPFRDEGAAFRIVRQRFAAHPDAQGRQAHAEVRHHRFIDGRGNAPARGCRCPSLGT